MSKHTFLSVVTSLFLLTTSTHATTLVVDKTGRGDYTSIQDAINNASDGDVVEVMPETYYEQINFYGRAITVTGTNPDDMGTVYGTVINGGTAGVNTVTFDSGEDRDSILQGITIENGERGIYCYYSDPLIRKCVIRYAKNNEAAGIQGSSASPTIENCEVRENAGYGISWCQGTIENCSIVENSSGGISDCHGLIRDCDISFNGSRGLIDCDGEINNCSVNQNALYGLSDCNGQIRNCEITQNRDQGLNYCRTAEVVNCLVTGNEGNGFYEFSGQIKNCTIVGNQYHGISMTTSNDYGPATIANCIITNNGSYGISNRYPERCPTTLKFNNIWANGLGNYNGLKPGATDTHHDPLFAVAGYWDENSWLEGDYHLQSEAGRWTENGWVNDSVTSSCVDAGDPSGGFYSEPEPNGDRINQGAYGGTELASKSPFGVDPWCTEFLAGDLNDDCQVDFTDLAVLAADWMKCNLEPASACWQ
ncbi:hypothetical protein STSP2_02975 [Anaerohalosphaera lusitana]|uniref:Pectate lyase C n=1 Tax=Anaerohalosphaera lusitana TaxID=1936003 RepID=A0A1U9NPY4_9BACT|nr:right-handed parallel beta-helix repeat-containing protein [Anaerohalosphaera lusitana]AQT69778.1 hypothetical protein STSP2_02975 [Anaerohalosphaera lusitana]